VRLVVPLTVLVALQLPWPGLGAERTPIASFDDPAGDANGPGYYQPPGDTDFLPGDFDLRRFAVFEEGDKVVFEVTLGENFRFPPSTQRYNSTPLDLHNNIYFQNIDIYLDTDQTPGSGYSMCIPGRRVAFADGQTWEYAVVLTPQPGPARAVTEGMLGEAAKRVLFATSLQTQGRTIIARIPKSFFNGSSPKGWGYSVHISGARWERSFSVVDRLAGRHESDAYTMPVIGVREAWAFGGAPEPYGKAHPFVVDVLLPPGVEQAKVLRSFDEKTGGYAHVPFVYGPGEAPPPVVAAAAAPAKTAAPALSVADVSGGVVSMRGPTKGVGVMQIGKVLGADGSPVAKVIVTQVIEGGVVGRAVEGGDQIHPGMSVEFVSPAPVR
jgi:carbohydrate-binding DOMON domain-containing protein